MHLLPLHPLFVRPCTETGTDADRHKHTHTHTCARARVTAEEYGGGGGGGGVEYSENSLSNVHGQLGGPAIVKLSNSYKELEANKTSSLEDNPFNHVDEA